MERIFYNEDNPAYLTSLDKLIEGLKNTTITDRTRKNRGNRRKLTQKWLNKQEAHTLHRPARLKFPRNHYQVFNLDDLWESDIIDLSKLKKYNDNFRYILTVIDVFSKYAFTYPLRTKGAAEVTRAFRLIIDNSEKEGGGFKRSPKVLQTDRGLEYNNAILKRFLSSRSISLQFPLTQSKHKASIAERFNQTIQSRIYKFFTARNTKRYIEILPKLTKHYNHTVHKTIKMKPVNVNERNVRLVYNNTRDFHKKKQEVDMNIYQQPFEIGSSVRVVRRKPIFEPGYTNRWSKEIFRIIKIIEKKPYFFYRIEDSQKRPVREKFYRHELQLIQK